MTIDVKKEERNLTIKIEGRLDTVTAPELEKVILDNVEGVDFLTFDLVDLEYISSAGLRTLLLAQKKFSDHGKMVIKNVKDTVMEVFEITGFDTILTIE